MHSFDGVGTIVGSLHLERETLGNHIELLLQLEVELQLVVGSLHETAIHIIIAEIGNTAPPTKGSWSVPQSSYWVSVAMYLPLMIPGLENGVA